MNGVSRFLAAVSVALALAASSIPASAEPPKGGAAPAAQAPTGEVRCPVMGEVVKNPATAAKSVYKGKTYYFCCPGCKPKFDADPEKYIGKASN